MTNREWLRKNSALAITTLMIKNYQNGNAGLECPIDYLMGRIHECPTLQRLPGSACWVPRHFQDGWNSDCEECFKLWLDRDHCEHSTATSKKEESSMPGLEGTNRDFLNTKIDTCDLLCKMNTNLRGAEMYDKCILDVVTGIPHECDPDIAGDGVGKGKPNCRACIAYWLNSPSEM